MGSLYTRVQEVRKTPPLAASRFLLLFQEAHGWLYLKKKKGKKEET